MRTTVDLDVRVLRQAKKFAAEEGKSLSQMIEEALRERLVHRPRSVKNFKLRLLTKTGRIIPAVSLADRDQLYERMEGRG